MLENPERPNLKTIANSPSVFIQSSKKVENTEKLLDYFKSSDEILKRFNMLPKIENKRTETDFEFLNQGMKNQIIKYSPDLKIRQENRITQV